MLQHLEKLNLIGHFKAPTQHKIRPVRTLKNAECLELVSGGHIFFSGPDGKNTSYGSGALFWHREGENTIYRYHTDDPYSCYFFEFDVNSKIRICPRVTIPLKTEQLMGFAEDVFRKFHAGEHEKPAFCAMVYSTLFYYATGPQRCSGESYPDKLKLAIEFIDQNFDSNLHLDEITEVAELSQSYLFSMFKEYLNISPHQYILNLRLNRAKQFLAAGEMTIKEIASACGFESMEVFYRQFSRNEGTTPAAYRKRFNLLDFN